MSSITLALQIFALALLIATTIYAKRTMKYAARQLYEMQSARQKSFLAQKYLEWSSVEMDEARMEIYLGSTPGVLEHKYFYIDRYRQIRMLSIPRFFDSLMVLIHMDAVDIDLVTDYFGCDAMYYWEVFSEVIPREREKRHHPDLFKSFEELAAASKREGKVAKGSTFWQLCN
jgi:hypothetical protein